MIYLDYSATTPVNKEVLESFNKVCLNYIGNPNSLHSLGVNAKKLIDASTSQIASILGVKTSEVIYTSGASEANNQAIKGICLKYQNRGKHIITTKLEHSSILATVHYLKQKGFKIDYVKINEDGLVDLDDLKRLLTKVDFSDFFNEFCLTKILFWFSFSVLVRHLQLQKRCNLFYL